MTETPDVWADDVYQPDESDGADGQQWVPQPDEEDSLVERGVPDALDEGYSPPEKPLAVDHFGTTWAEGEEGESLDQRLSEEVPDIAYPDAEDDGIGDQEGTDGEARDENEVGDARSGRLVSPDEGTRENTEGDLIASDLGIDGSAASAEEAAVHTIPDEDL